MTMGFDFATSLTIWGAAWSDNAYEPDAVLAESGEALWDQNESYLESLELHVEGEKVATPRYWALPAIALLLILRPELHPASLKPAND